MKNKKDIGQAFKERLSESAISPKDSLWNKIEQTLNYREKRRKRAFYLWVGTAVMGIAILFILTQVDSNSEIEHVTTNTQSDKTTDINSSSEKNNMNFQIDSSSVNSTSELQDNSEENKSLIPENNLRTAEINSDKSKKRVQKINKTEGFEVKSTYYYYDSKTQKQVMTTDKKVIDSILLETKKLADTLKPLPNTVQKDSLH